MKHTKKIFNKISLLSICCPRNYMVIPDKVKYVYMLQSTDILTIGRLKFENRSDVKYYLYCDKNTVKP